MGKLTIAINAAPSFFTIAQLAFGSGIPLIAVRQSAAYCVVSILMVHFQIMRDEPTWCETILSPKAGRAPTLPIVRVTLSGIATIEGRQQAVEAGRAFLGFAWPAWSSRWHLAISAY